MSSIKDAELTGTELMSEEHMSKKDTCIIGHGGKTGGWITVLPNVMNGSILSDLEFRDGFHLCYVMTLQNLPTHCDGCNAKCNIDHAFNCKKGGLVITRHNEVKDELGFLATLAIHRQRMQSATNHSFSLVALQIVKAIMNPIHALMFNLLTTMKEIEAIYYFVEFGNDKHTVLWTFVSQMLIRDLISHQHQRRFYVVKKWRRKRSIFRPVWTNEEISLHL
eukprot:scaffold103337_cov31-Attheya_sp.AAC.1